MQSNNYEPISQKKCKNSPNKQQKKQYRPTKEKNFKQKTHTKKKEKKRLSDLLPKQKPPPTNAAPVQPELQPGAQPRCPKQHRPQYSSVWPTGGRLRLQLRWLVGLPAGVAGCFDLLWGLVDLVMVALCCFGYFDKLLW